MGKGEGEVNRKMNIFATLNPCLYIFCFNVNFSGKQNNRCGSDRLFFDER